MCDLCLRFGVWKDFKIFRTFHIKSKRANLQIHTLLMVFEEFFWLKVGRLLYFEILQYCL